MYISLSFCLFTIDPNKRRCPILVTLRNVFKNVAQFQGRNSEPSSNSSLLPRVTRGIDVAIDIPHHSLDFCLGLHSIKQRDIVPSRPQELDLSPRIPLLNINHIRHQLVVNAWVLNSFHDVLAVVINIEHGLDFKKRIDTSVLAEKKIRYGISRKRHVYTTCFT